MAYTLEEKAVHEYRLKQVKTALKKRGIKYYVPVVRAIDSDVDAKKLHNVMSGGSMDGNYLQLLEQAAGIKQAA